MAKRQFNKESTFDRLVENALDFLSKAISELDDNPKYSVIHFYAALELFLKARLMAEHWTLVVAKQKEPDLDKFLSGDFQSVSLRDAATRLDKVVRSGLSKQVREAFENVGKHRNRMVHFFHETHTKEEKDIVKQEIVKQQLNAWYFLNRLLTVKWKEVFESCAKQIAEIDAVLRQLHDFLQVVFEDLTPEIEKRKGQDMQFGICPSCQFESQEYEDKTNSISEAKCLVCKITEKRLQIICPECDSLIVFVNEGFARCPSCDKSFEPDDVVNILEPSLDYAAGKQGLDSWDPGDCGSCGSYHTVVYMEENGECFCTHCFEEGELHEQ